MTSSCPYIARRRCAARSCGPSRCSERRVQLIVLAPEAVVAQTRDWELIDTIDPNSARWMEWLKRVPKLPLLPDFRQEPLRNGKSSALRHQDQDLVQLAPGGWQAYPLPVENDRHNRTCWRSSIPATSRRHWGSASWSPTRWARSSRWVSTAACTSRRPRPATSRACSATS